MINQFKSIFTGKQAITDTFRYECARIGVGMVHIILLIFVSIIKCYPLIIFNCFSVIFYAVIIEIFIRKRMYLTALISTYSEIIIHSLVASILLGWNFGFSLYNISLLYIAYYFSYISPRLSKKILLPTVLGLINLISSLVVRLYVYSSGPQYPKDISEWSFPISAMNYFMTSVMVMLFASLHTVEIRKKSYELQKTNRMLNELAHYDKLTKLRNRYSLEEVIQEIGDDSDEEYCFIMGDIDNFKHFNDTYGHACGDHVLKTVANIVQKNTGENNISCRWGGEEILIFLHGNLEYGHIIAEKIRYEIEHMQETYHGSDLHITMTFGVSYYKEDTSLEKVINIADKRLYKGKQAGKNRVIYED